jgi:6-phosphogluconolactonase
MRAALGMVILLCLGASAWGLEAIGPTEANQVTGVAAVQATGPVTSITASPTTKEPDAPVSTCPDQLVIIGSMTGDAAEPGLHTFRLDGQTGALTPLAAVAGMQSPGWLALDRAGEHLFAAGCVWNAGRVGAFAVDAPSGALTLQSLATSGGGETCHVALDATERFVACANYADGTAAVLPVQADGGLGAPVALVRHEGSSVNPQRQEASHPHSVTFTPDNRRLLVADLGTDKLMVYAFDEGTGALTPGSQPWFAAHPGAGPRHLAFHPSGRTAYLANELDSTVTVLAYDGDAGTLTELQVVPMLPADFTGHSTAADVHVTPDGRFVYASNRGHDSLAIYAVDPETGRLTVLGHQLTGGRPPRGFGVDPTGHWVVVANQDTSTVAVFALDDATGTLAPAGPPVEVPAPCCVAFLAPEGH